MPEHKIHILSTRPVEQLPLEEARRKGIKLDVLPFIETEAVQNIEIQQEIEWVSVQQATVAFTSMNAVIAVIEMLDGYVPDWSIYCLGFKTKQLVAEYFGEQSISGTAENASELANEIIENEDPEELVFFCGNLRRDELPAILNKHHISVNEIVVYETHAIHHKVDKVYDAVLFFSPSAVESFFSNNKLPAHTVVFVIGNTTNKAVLKHCHNKSIVSKLPGKEELIEEAIAFFSE